jgi:hypothetical protein
MFKNIETKFLLSKLPISFRMLSIIASNKFKELIVE